MSFETPPSADHNGDKFTYVSLGPEEEEKKGASSQADEELFKHLTYLS